MSVVDRYHIFLYKFYQFFCVLKIESQLSINVIVIILLLIKAVGCARMGDSESTLSVRGPQPRTTNLLQEDIEKTVENIILS